MTDLLKDRVIVAIGDQFDIGDELGRGGMSVVYSALDLRLMRQVAVKVLPPEFAYDNGIRERFRREAQMAAQLNHPHIIPIFSVDERDGIAYFVMALCDGESLGVRLARTKRPPLTDVRRILAEVADALSYAHGRGVVHRDIKPDNVLLERDSGRALVTDFGIARAAEGGSRLTVTGIAMGTPAYMSPEQALGEHELDGRSDIYSLGAVAYQLVAGVPPFTASNTPSILLKHVSEELVPLAVRRPDVPARLASLVERALEKDPDRRWQTATDLRDALLDPVLLQDGRRPILPQPQRTHERRESQPPRQRSGSASGVRPSALPRQANRERPGDAALQRHPAPFRDQADDVDLGRAALSAGEDKWFRLWRKEQLDAINKRIRSVRRGTVVASLFTGFTAFMTLAIGGSGGDDEVVVMWLMSMFPTVICSTVLFARARWLKKRGIGFWQALKARAEVSYRLPSPPATTQPGGIPLSAEVMQGSFGHVVQQAVQDRSMIEQVMQRMPAADRKLLPDVLPTVRALVDRVISLAPTLHSLDLDIRREDFARLDARIAAIEAEPDRNDSRERTLQLLLRQRSTLDDLVNRRDVLQSQMESAAILLQNIKLDLLRVGSAGASGSLHEVNSATQEARALSRELGHVISVADELEKL